MSESTHVRRSVPNVTCGQLDQRIQSLHGVGVTEVLESIAYLREPGDTVIAGGSLALGLGNGLSDLDLTLVGERTATSSRIPLEHFVGSLRVDVWNMSNELIADVFERARRGLDETGRIDEIFANQDDEVNLKLLHRMAAGVILDGPPSYVAAAAAEHRGVAAHAVAREYLERAREHALIAVVAAQLMSLPTAAFNIRDALEEILHARITAQGVPFSGHKWFLERLAEDTTGIAERYERFGEIPASPAELETYIRECLDECEAQSGLDLTPPALTRHCRWTTPPLELFPVGKHKNFIVDRSLGALWEVDAAESDTWRSLLASVTENDVDRFEWVHEDLSTAEVTLLFRLFELGVATLRWSAGIEFEAVRRLA